MARRREPKHPQRLAKLRAARARYSTKRMELEAKAALLVENGMAAEDALINQLVRELYDGGETIAEIQRAYGTRDYQTIKDIIESTVSEFGIDVTNDIYSYNDETKILSVNYTSHGSQELTGAATVGVWDDKNGGIMFLPFDGVTTPLYGDDFLQNRIVHLLSPLASDNEYKLEALTFLETQNVTLEKKPKNVLDFSPEEEENVSNDLRKFLSEAEDDELGGFE